jgi:hypothetical protein
MLAVIVSRCLLSIWFQSRVDVAVEPFELTTVIRSGVTSLVVCVFGVGLSQITTSVTWYTQTSPSLTSGRSARNGVCAALCLASGLRPQATNS